MSSMPIFDSAELNESYVDTTWQKRNTVYRSMHALPALLYWEHKCLLKKRLNPNFFHRFNLMKDSPKPTVVKIVQTKYMQTI